MADETGKTPCALVVMGVSGSGKSTIAEKLAERLGWTYEDGDRFHPASNVAKMSAGHPLTDEDRWPWLQAIADEIDRVCQAGETCRDRLLGAEARLSDVLVHGRRDVRIVFLNGTQQLIADRLARAKAISCRPDCWTASSGRWSRRTDENPVTVSIDASVDAIVETSSASSGCATQTPIRRPGNRS